MSNVAGKPQVSRTPGKKTVNVETACGVCRKRYYESLGACPFCLGKPAEAAVVPSAAPVPDLFPALRTSSWAEECAEWQAIAEELETRSDDGQEPFVFTAHDVTQEQRRRMAERGERPMSYEEILKDIGDRQTVDRLVG